MIKPRSQGADPSAHTTIQHSAGRRTINRRTLLISGVAAFGAAGCRTTIGAKPAPTIRGPLATLAGHTDIVASVAFSRDGRFLASGSNDKTIRLWGVATRSTVATLAGEPDVVQSVAFSPDGRLIAAGDNDTTIRLWDAATYANVATLTGNEKVVHSVAFSRDGKIIASGGSDKTIRLWDTATHAMTATLAGHADVVTSVAFSPDGRTLASGSWDKTIRLWDVATLPGSATTPTKSRRWRLARTEKLSPAAAGTTRTGCGTWQPAPRGSYSRAIPNLSIRWRLARREERLRAAAQTRRSAFGPSIDLSVAVSRRIPHANPACAEWACFI
jgi:hypothetical protein